MTVTLHKPAHGPPGDEKALLDRLYDDLRRKHQGIQLVYRSPAWQKWQAELHAWPDRTGSDQHVIYVPGSWLPELAAKGLLKDLSAAMPEDVRRWEARYPAGVFGMGQVNGRQYGIPVYGAVWCFMYNKRLLESAGLTSPPATWDELLQYAARLKAASGDVIPYGINDDSDGHFIDHGFVYLLAGGLAEWKGKDGRVRFDNDWSVKGLSLLQNMVSKGLANMPVNAPSHRIMDLFLTGRVAMTVGPSDWILQQRRRFPDFPLRVAIMPCPQGGQPLSYASSGLYCLVAGDRQDSAAARLLGALLEPRHLERHIRAVGMLPLQTGMDLYGQDAELSVFARQVALSGSLPAAATGIVGALTREMLSCLSLEKSPEEALRTATAPL